MVGFEKGRWHLDNAPERIWIDKHGGNRYVVYSKQNKGSPEYIRKDTADKEACKMFTKGHMDKDEQYDKQLKEILQPIRDVKKKMFPTIQVKWNWENLYRELTEAINETLRRADG